MECFQFLRENKKEAHVQFWALRHGWTLGSLGDSDKSSQSSPDPMSEGGGRGNVLGEINLE